MKRFPTLIGGAQAFAGVARRRRTRAVAVAPQALTYDVAKLHVQVLVAFAAVDGRMTHAELDEVLEIVERFSLSVVDRAELVRVVRASAAAPLDMEAACERLDAASLTPARARVLVADLTKVAAVEAAAHPRELLFLDAVCEALGLDPVQLVRPEPQVIDTRPSVSSWAHMDEHVVQRIHADVVRALQA